MDNSIIAIIIAGLALMSTFIWNWRIAYITRKHNRLSFRPILKVRSDWVEGRKFKIVIRNVGNGPCIIEKIEFIHSPDNRTFDDIRDLLKYFEPNVIDRDLLKLECWFMDLLKIVNGYALGKNEETEIATLYRSSGENIVGKDYFTLFEDTYVKIEFKDIYDKKDNIKLPVIVHEHDAEFMLK